MELGGVVHHLAVDFTTPSGIFGRQLKRKRQKEHWGGAKSKNLGLR